VLINLGASAIATAAATYGYDVYLSEGERIGMGLAMRVGLGRALQLMGAAGELPNGYSFNIERQGNPTIHVIMVQRNGQWYFTAFHMEVQYTFLWFGRHYVPVDDIRLGDVPAYHIPRPLRGENSDPWANYGIPPQRAPGAPESLLRPQTPMAVAQ
jgi:hypothetical protein